MHVLSPLIGWQHFLSVCGGVMPDALMQLALRPDISLVFCFGKFSVSSEVRIAS